jgi:C-terminal processing protease CtpA/Prc
MKKLQVIFLLLITCAGLFAQKEANLDFEILENNEAKDWSAFGDGNHKISFDANTSQNGSVSGTIESTGATSKFKALAYNIPADFGGKKIKLSGYIKTENVEGGWAGLWMRIDPQIAFDNMKSRGIKGTTDWKKYEIELDYNSSAKTVVVGGLLVGTGKIWIDNLKVTVDGKSLDKAPEKELTKAQKDTEFDKGSNITFNSLDKKQIENLELLGRIWGFLKYYHPNIGTGNYNWDYELFRVLPTYQKATTNTERDNVLLSWIDSYGKIEPCKKCKQVSEDAFLKPDLKWISAGHISKSLSQKLQYIQKNRHQGEHYYVGTMPGVGNPEFKNENSYADMPYPDEGFRLLSVYRYWNMINYFFPYKHLMDKNWNTTLSEYIPKFLNAKNELDYELAAIKMIGDIKDTHANLWGGNNKIQEQRGNYYAPFHVKFVENQLVVDDLFDDEKSKTSGLQIGDIITHINGKSVDNIVQEANSLYPASNQPTRLRDISFNILRSKDSSMSLKVSSSGRSIDKTIDLYLSKDIEGYYTWYKKRTERSFKKLNNDIGYITLQNITKEDINSLKDEFKGTKGIIVDIRNYPSEFVPFTLGNYLNKNRAPFVKFTQVNPDHPGEFVFRDGHKVGISRGWTYKGEKVIVLVNEISQSQAEYTAMAFKAGDRTTIIGSTTAGADGNVSSISLPGGMRTAISGIGVYYPDGTETQRVGIVPDIEVKPTIEGIKDGRDELMEKAIELIQKSIRSSNSIKD